MYGSGTNMSIQTIVNRPELAVFSVMQTSLLSYCPLSLLLSGIVNTTV